MKISWKTPENSQKTLKKIQKQTNRQQNHTRTVKAINQCDLRLIITRLF